MTILEELYYGNISPAVREIRKDGEFNSILQELATLEDSFMESIGKEKKEEYEKMSELNSELQGIREFALFRYGFKLGLGLTVEALCEEDENFKNI